jgi:hypothetical protein
MFLSAPQRLTPATWRGRDISQRAEWCGAFSQVRETTHVLDEGDPEAGGLCAGQRLLRSAHSHFYTAYAVHSTPVLLAPSAWPASYVLRILLCDPQSNQHSSARSDHPTSAPLLARASSHFTHQTTSSTSPPPPCSCTQSSSR